MIAAGALIIGITLGLLGSGGSAITVPVLVYLVGHATKQSIAESMAIVGLISLAAAIPYARSQQVSWRFVALFGLPGAVGTLLGAWVGGFSPPALQLVVFGAVMLFAAWTMLRDRKEKRDEASESPQHSNTQIGLEGAMTGALTGFVGVGGGFLIVPALVAFGKLPIRLAMGTSLVIITLSSSIGFMKYQQYLVAEGTSVDFNTVLIFVLVGIVGSLIGKGINAYLPPQKLKAGFAAFLILTSVLILAQEGSKLFTPNHPATPALPTSVRNSETVNFQMHPTAKEQCDAT